MRQFRKFRTSNVLLAVIHLMYQLQQDHVAAIQCPVATSFLEWRGDTISPENCSVIAGISGRSWCSLQCHDDLLCVAWMFTCDPQCVCQICRGVTSSDVDAQAVFSLRRRALVYNIPAPLNLLVHVWLSGGLYPGHVLDVVFDFSSQSLAMMLSTGPQDQQDQDTYALFFTMNMASGGTERMSKVQGQEYRELDEPNFPFVANKSFHVVIVTDIEEFEIYIDSQIYCTFRHRVSELDTIQHLNFQPYTQPIIRKLSF